MAGQDDILRDMILDVVPSDGSNIGNQALLTVLQDRAPGVSEEAYQAARDALVHEGVLGKGRGVGSLLQKTVRRRDGPR